uniref:Uncharacterized protein n=1 Tax=viral metagenome TaxID=1070528 RepID=A0A6M3IXC3_9ZZZZ
MDKILVGVGVWLLSDGIYSWLLYLQADSYNGKHQTFLRDHWIRLLRILCALVIIWVGAVN